MLDEPSSNLDAYAIADFRQLLFTLKSQGKTCLLYTSQTCICYRKTNDCKKGNDSYQNLLLLSLQGLAIVSSEDMMSVVALVKEYSLNAKVITKVNKLRATAGLPLLAAK